jgi:hypothetical protein
MGNLSNPSFPPLEKGGSCEKIQIWMGKTLLVVQGAEKFARPKSRGQE